MAFVVKHIVAWYM